MATEVLMPKLGNTVESCLLLEWKKQEGDTIHIGDVLCEVETDKAAFQIEAEQELLSQNEVPFTIIRPPGVIGPEDNLGRCQFYLQRLLDGQPLILTNGGIQSVQPVYSKDLARAYILALGNGKAMNQTYTVAQPKTFRHVDWVELAARCLAVKPNLVSIPAEVMRDAGFVYAEPWTYTATFTFDVSRAVADLGFRPTSVESWTDITARWYRDAQHSEDTAGYADRALEVLFAQTFVDANRKLASYTKHD